MNVWFATTMLCVCILSACSKRTDQYAQPYGVWRATTYEIQGIRHKQDGIIIITPGYMMSNTVFDADGDDIPDANVNSGPIRLQDGVLEIEQWMQLHWRTADDDGNFLSQGAVERIPYTVRGDLLIFEFPSGNRYISERLSHLTTSPARN